MSLFLPDDNDERCDVCGAPLDPEDTSIHLCKFCQEDQFNDR